MKEPFLSAVPVIKRLESAGYEAYFVGGSVRDYLLGNKISDVDIATSATPDEVKAIFPKTVDIGIQHGTVLVLLKNNSYEITTFRTEGEYQDFRRPKEVSFIRNLNEDLMRRDFTMNAIAMDANGSIIDPFDGQTAIKERVIRTVGSPEERFREDALRMMRAVRFVSQLSFHIAGETLLALKKDAHLLDKIAVERKRAEFEKLLSGDNRKKAFRILLETQVFEYLPGLKNQELKIEKLLSYLCDSLNKKEMWALLLYCLELNQQDSEAFLRNWRLPVKEMKEIQDILLYAKQRLIKDWSRYDLYTAGSETIQSAEKLYLVLKGINDYDSVKYWLNTYDHLPIKQRSELAVTGSDIMAWREQAGGPWLKELLTRIEHAVLQDEVVNEKEKIKEWLKACSQKSEKNC
ncbi:MULTISPECIES: CCA tRNA nucleotidyltransferase [Neobacillus]|uniref:CCA-adding enzyme n=1 Tax=Neobacillus citreus TaxID=2833578 RepID=A0A942YB20_9BACI|nr:CCA tRNA nucleotidyltransferase [Neobacillus citreus]MCH6268538.1 CCA tRNA nucleotidyltransferase [Neobacillus citreus]